MRPIINKNDELVKKYLEVREQLIFECRNNSRRINKGIYYIENKDTNSSVIDWALEEGKIDSLLYEYDKNLSYRNFSKKEKDLLDSYDPILQIVEHDYIAYEHRSGTYSFKTKEERNDFLKNESEEHDYDAFAEYELCEINEIKGTLLDNYDDLIDKYENGYNLFIRADSVHDDNIKIAYIEE